MDVIAYTLTDFSSNCMQSSRSSNNHERTSFVKYIVPMFKYFSQETNLIEFSWCEKGLETYGMAALESNGFYMSHSDRKYVDALSKSGKWKFIEVRSSHTPTSWKLSGFWKPLFEILATVYDELLEQRKLDNQIMEVVCGLRTLPSQSVADRFLNVNV